ncbi:hypothetical protein M433DRAFT_114914 [Acidomyces richmondensis BFW]|nr:hypothetical protein M433DRAFT_114914 [Acidomyces richmondensis BFW]
MNFISLSPGQRIELNDGRIATVRFVGTTSFQTGDWVGVELEDPTGKNDGSVKGERYFDCEPGHGMFLRPSGVRQVIAEAKHKTKTASAGNGVSGKARPSSVHAAVNGVKRQSLTDGPGRRASVIPGSPTPGPKLPSRIGSPTKLSGSNTVSSSSTSRTNTPPVGKRPASGAPAMKPRQSMAPPSVAAAAAGRRTSTLPGTSSTATARTTKPSLSAPLVGSRTAAARGILGRTAPARAPASGLGPAQRTSSTTEETASIHSQRTIRSTTAANRQIEELEAKVRLLERKRQEDRDMKKDMEQAQQERDQYKGIIEKLQNKYRPQQQEIAFLKEALSEAEKKVADIEALQAEHDSVVELATLDREMAEEKAEALQAELDALRAKNEEMELELELLTEENQELSKEMSPEERTSAGWLQLEKSNERLREALLRLRDITQDKEAELKEQIESLEEQVKELDALRVEQSETKEKLLRCEADTNDLRQQLEVALESEDIIEGLTERNGSLENQLAQLRVTIEELEDLRELNDELQVNYSEQEKQLQEEIDFKDSLLLDRERTAKQQQEALDEADYTITRYRALVSQMQSDLADMQASKQLSETEAAELNSKSRAMLELNMKLQSSAAKTQVKTIDLELRKLEAQEALEHLAIVQLFLPEAFNAERDSILALLRFKRIGFKANLVQGFIKERIASFGNRGQDEDVFAACDVLDKLTWITTMSDRFVNSICSCTVNEFAAYESALYELEPVERALNSYIDGLRREEIKEKIMAEELQRSIAVMSHLAGLHVKDDLASHSDSLLARTQCLQSQLETSATALGLARSLIESNVKASANSEDEDEPESLSHLALILNRAETLMSHARNAKVMAGKAQRSLADLQARSLTLEKVHTEIFDAAEAAAAEIAAYTRQAGEALQLLFGEEGRNEPFTTDEVAAALSRVASKAFSLPTPEAGPFAALAMRIRGLTDMLADLASLATDLDNTVEFERAPAPWVARADELKQKKITSIDTEAELYKALENLRARDVLIHEKENELEEQSLKIEMLDARLKDASKRTVRIVELERALNDARNDEKRARADLSRVKLDAEKHMERVREEMARLADEKRQKRGSGIDLDDIAMGAGAQMTMKRFQRKVNNLESAIRYLQEENQRLRLPGPDSPLSARMKLGWLHDEPLTKVKTEKRKHQETLQKEGKDVLLQMLNMAATPRFVDLSKIPENKLAWRPAKETARWGVERGKEAWEGLRDWRRDVIWSASKPALNGVTCAPVND